MQEELNQNDQDQIDISLAGEHFERASNEIQYLLADVLGGYLDLQKPVADGDAAVVSGVIGGITAGLLITATQTMTGTANIDEKFAGELIASIARKLFRDLHAAVGPLMDPDSPYRKQDEEQATASEQAPVPTDEMMAAATV